MNKSKGKEIPQIAYCGHHCRYCFYHDCSGCRSDNPTCSYANLFQDKKCPNVKCCVSKGLTGCYECSDLSNCVHGFYSRKEEQVAKGTALFIQKYGLEKYDQTLENAIQKGIKYPEQFNHLESVHHMIELLENYIFQQRK